MTSEQMNDPQGVEADRRDAPQRFVAAALRVAIPWLVLLGVLALLLLGLFVGTTELQSLPNGRDLTLQHGVSLLKLLFIHWIPNTVLLAIGAAYLGAVARHAEDHGTGLPRTWAAVGRGFLVWLYLVATRTWFGNSDFSVDITQLEYSKIVFPVLFVGFVFGMSPRTVQSLIRAERDASPVRG